MRIIGLLTAFVALAACATVAEYRIEDSLRDIGIAPQRADCMAGQLRDRLDGDQLNELADFLSSLTGADSTGEGVDVLLDIENPGIVGAVLKSGISCGFSPNR